VLELLILCISLPDVKILGALPSLHFLKLRIVGGTNERIVIRGSDRFGIAFTNYILTCGNPLALRASNDLLYNTSIFFNLFSKSEFFQPVVPQASQRCLWAF